jgi:hypothetical protein
MVLKEEFTMTEQEEERILQAKIFIENLPTKEKKLVENYIDSFTDHLLWKKFFFISMDS